MKRVQIVIEERRRQFDACPFFKRWDGEGSLAEALAFYPHLTFFTMGFQDILRRNHERIRNPELREIAHRHMIEDAQHEQWFLNDLETFHMKPDLRWAFGPDHVETRDAAYDMIAEFHRVTCDEVRIALLIALEAAGGCLFSRLPRYIERTGYSGPIEYFSAAHYRIEKGHDLHEKQNREKIESIVLSPPVLEEALDAVNRCFDILMRLFDAYENMMQARQRKDARVPARETPLIAGSASGA